MSRRGPKRIAGKREPNGRLSRHSTDEKARELAAIDRTEWDAMSAGILARTRVYGVALTDARDQRAGTAIGRLAMVGRKADGLSASQYDAALKYLEDRANASRAVDTPHEPGAVDLNAVHGRPVGQEQVERIRRNIKRYKEARAAVQECINHHAGRPQLFAALYEFLIADRDHHHMRGDLRLALNALAHHYGMERAKEAA